jgi:hypothetical protein
MLDLIEGIGPFAGLAAFIALAVLVFVIFQQSREIRRLREWAGRAPERAAEAAEASLAAAEARGEVTAAEKEEGPGRIAALRERVVGALGPPLRDVDRRLPMDGRIVLGVVAVLAVAAGVYTGGFGLGDDDDGKQGTEGREAKPKVAVLNATQTGGVQGVPGLAGKVAKQVVQPAGYKVSLQTDAPTGFGQSVVMYTPKAEGAAAQLARAIEAKLGSTRIQPIAADVRQQAENASVVLVVGADDADF